MFQASQEQWPSIYQILSRPSFLMDIANEIREPESEHQFFDSEMPSENIATGVLENEDADSEESDIDMVNPSVFSFTDRKPPTVPSAMDALVDLNVILRPPHAIGHGFKDLGIDKFMREQLKEMCTFLNHFISITSPNHGSWMAVLQSMACGTNKGPWHTHQLRACMDKGLHK